VSAGKVVLVTGGSGHLGAATALAFARSGWTVGVHYRQHAQAAGSVVEAISQAGGHAAAFGADLAGDGADHASRELMSQLMEQFGRLDAVVNNSADQTTVPISELTDSDWQRMFDANLYATTRTTRAALEVLAPGGCVVNVSSVEASSAFPNHAHYAASKAAIESFTRSLAIELGPRGMRANCVAPGLIAREDLEQEWPEGWNWWTESAPNARPVSAAEVAAVIVFLAGAQAGGVNGAVVPVDGGWSASARVSF